MKQPFASHSFILRIEKIKSNAKVGAFSVVEVRVQTIDKSSTEANILTIIISLFIRMAKTACSILCNE